MTDDERKIRRSQTVATTEDTAPTGLDLVLGLGSTKMSHLRCFGFKSAGLAEHGKLGWMRAIPSELLENDTRE